MNSDKLNTPMTFGNFIGAAIVIVIGFVGLLIWALS